MRMSKIPEKSEANGGKRSLYPYYSLERCLELAAAIRELGGARTEVPKSTLAHQMHVEESAPAFIQLIGSAKAFGLIEGRGTYTLSELAKQHFFPTDDGQDRVAILRVLKAPQAFEELIDRFDGTKVPGTELLSNILHREYQIAASWAPRVASLFIGALRFAGALDADGILRYQSNIQGILTEAGAVRAASRQQAPAPIEIVPPDHATPTARGIAEPKQPVAVDANVWSFTIGDETVHLRTSRELSYGLWLKLRQYVELLNPTSETPGGS